MRSTWLIASLLVVAVVGGTPVLGDTTTKADTYGFKSDASAPLPKDAKGTPATVAQILQTLESTHDITAAKKALKDVPSISRWVGATKGDVVRIYACHHTSNDNPRHAAISPDEVARSLHISEQMRDVFKIANALNTQIAGGSEEVTVTHTDYVLKEVRATLTIAGRVEKGLGEAGVDESKKPAWIVLLDFTGGGKSTDAADASISILTGPREPWSISANVPLRKTGDVKLNGDATGIVLKADKPTAFYVGFDYTWGDVLSTPKSWPEAFEVKGLLKASRAPLDSYGLALALRGGIWAEMFPKQNILHIFDTITPFVGITRTHVTKDAADASGKTVRLRGHSQEVQVGLSFDIKKAVDWVQKPAAKSATEKQ